MCIRIPVGIVLRFLLFLYVHIHHILIQERCNLVVLLNTVGIPRTHGKTLNPMCILHPIRILFMG